MTELNGRPMTDRLLDEAYRRITHRLALLQGKDATIVLVASAVHGEGSSTVARRLAAALAEGQSGRVLLVDANVRSAPKGGANRPRALLFTGVAGGHDVRERAFPLPSRSLAVVPRRHDPLSSTQHGLGAPDGIHLLRGGELEEAFSRLRRLHDWVVIDGPPVTLYTEAAALSAHADATVLVLRAESTRSEVAARARNIIHQSGGHLVGAILNRRRYHIPDFIYRHL